MGEALIAAALFNMCDVNVVGDAAALRCVSINEITFGLIGELRCCSFVNLQWFFFYDLQWFAPPLTKSHLVLLAKPEPLLRAGDVWFLRVQCMYAILTLQMNNQTLSYITTLSSITYSFIYKIGETGAVAEGWRCLGPARYDVCGLWGVCKKRSQPMKMTIERQDNNGRVVIAGARAAAAVAETTLKYVVQRHVTPFMLLISGYTNLQIILQCNTTLSA
jgi:hypothetical protein